MTLIDLDVLKKWLGEVRQNFEKHLKEEPKYKPIAFKSCICLIDGILRNLHKVPTVKAVALPCKVGDTVWLTRWWAGMNFIERNPPIPRNVHYFRITKEGVVMHFHDGCIGVDAVGEVVFLTHKEAKIALAQKDLNEAIDDICKEGDHG